MKKILLTVTAAIFVLGLGLAYAGDDMIKDKDTGAMARENDSLINSLDPTNAPIEVGAVDYGAEGSAAGGITPGPDSLLKSLDPSEEPSDNGPVKGGAGFPVDHYPW